jgi:iron complex outermembrane recepter protein
MLAVVLSCLLQAVGSGAVPSKWPVSGLVRDDVGRPVVGARVVRVDGPETAVTDTAGAFRLELPRGSFVLRASRDGYLHSSVAVEIDGPRPDLVIALQVAPRLDETVVVEAVRAADWVPVTVTDVPREELSLLDRGQEMPFLLKATPSLTQYSDNGSEGGYSYLYLRGIPQTRLNLTLDGVPLADAEDNAFYWVNLGGLAGVLDSLQIQRGVGTSSFGSASFGGSVNLASLRPRDASALQAEASLGSLETARGRVAAHSGRFGPGLTAFAAATYQETEGFRDHSGVRQRSLAFGLSRQTSTSFLKVFGLAGREQQQLAFLAVDEDTLREQPRENPLSPAERDRFGQELLHAQLSHALSPTTHLTLKAYTNGAGGWYRIYADPERTSLFEYGLDWRSVGGIASVTHKRGRFELTTGGHVQGFASTHRRDVVDVGPDYRNHGDKDEGSVFAKAGYAAGRWSVWADAQVRAARFRYDGDLELGSVDYTFFNPRAGARFAIGPSLSVYASLGRTTREPARSDLFAGEDNPTLPYDLRAVRPERLVDLEAGADWKTERASLAANLYLMEFRDEIAQTGELSEIGLPLRRNVDRSYRRGLELEGAFRLAPSFRLSAGASLNGSRIRSWTQFLDVYDENGAFVTTEPRTFEDVPPLLTPAFVGSATLGYERGPGKLAVTGRYVSPAHLDNTGDDRTRTPGFFDADLRGRLRVKRFKSGGEVALRLDLGNLAGRVRWPSGYSYLFLTRAGSEERPGHVSYFYPLAGRTVFIGLELGL